MVLDRFENFDKYTNNQSLATAINFIKNLNVNSEEKKYDIDGENIFAMVMSYSSKNRNDAILESHKRYVDVQAVLSGTEVMEWYPVEELNVETEYNAKKDVMFYTKPQHSRSVFHVIEGDFAVFFPTDAHLTQMTSSKVPVQIKKVVVKISLDLFTELTY